MAQRKARNRARSRIIVSTRALLGSRLCYALHRQAHLLIEHLEKCANTSSDFAWRTNSPGANGRSRQSHKSTFATFAGWLSSCQSRRSLCFGRWGNIRTGLKASSDPSTENAAESTPATSSRVALTAPTPRLVLTASPLLGSDEELPLGLSVQGGSDGMGITVGGLMAGTTVTAGRASGANGWWLGLADVDGARIKRPPGYVGTMHLAVELRLADGW